MVGNGTGEKYVETYKLCLWVWLFWEKKKERGDRKKVGECAGLIALAGKPGYRF